MNGDLVDKQKFKYIFFDNNDILSTDEWKVLNFWEAWTEGTFLFWGLPVLTTIASLN